MRAPLTTRSRMVGMPRTRTLRLPSFGISLHRFRIGRYVSALAVRPGSALEEHFHVACLDDLEGAPCRFPGPRCSSWPCRVGFAKRVHLADVDVQPPAARPVRPSPCRIASAAGLADRWVPLSSHPCLPCWWRNCRTAGLLRSTGVTPLRRYYEPIRHPLVVSPLPSAAGYRALPSFRRFRSGRGGLLQLLDASSATMPSLTTPPERPAASFGLRRAVLLSPSRLRARPPGLRPFGATTRSLPLRPGDSQSIPGTGSSRASGQSVSSLPALQLRGRTLTPAGLIPAEHISLTWTHNRPGLCR